MFDLFFSYVYRFLSEYLGVRRPLSDREKTLAWMFSLYDFNYTLSSVFLNVFLYKAHQDFATSGAFNLTQFAVIAPAFWVGGHLSKRFGNVLSYQLGFFFSASVFGTALALREGAADHPVLLGVLAGLGIGFYFLGEHSLTLEMTSEGTRDYFLSLTTFFTSVLCILAPQISGWLIAGMKPTELVEGLPLPGGESLLGYYIVFAMALAIYLLLTFKSLQFHAVPTERSFDLWKVLTFKDNGDWNRLMGAQFLLGLRNGVFWFVMALLVYRVSKNEAVVGGYSTFVNLLGIMTSYGLSLWANKKNRWQGLWISSWLLGSASIGLFFKVSYLSLLMYGVLAAVGATWLQIVFGAFSFTILEMAKEAKGHRIEYLAAREFPLALGRVLGLGLFLLGQSHFGERGLHWALLTLGFSHMGVFFFLPKGKVDEIHSAMDKKA